MARSTEFYKGSKKRRNYVFVPVAILLALLALLIVLFYSMQKYAVITKDDVRVKVPMLSAQSEDGTPSADSDEQLLESTTVSVVVDAPDYSTVAPIAPIADLRGMRAIFVPHDDLNAEKLEEYAGRLSTGNALMLEMKPTSGNLMWYSNSTAAFNYGLSVDNETTRSMQSYIDMLKERDVYLVAYISCCVDERYPSYSTMVALKSDSGMNYYDKTGMWLDPYSPNVREYVVEMVNELYAMGFDEVTLGYVMHPVPEEGREVNFLYNREMTATPSPVTAVSGFAISVAQDLSDRPAGKALSIYAYTSASLVRADEQTGQNVPLFFKLYDRVYYPTDRYLYNFNLEDITHSISQQEAAVRFVPVVQNYLPDNPAEISWVLIDVDEDE